MGGAKLELRPVPVETKIEAVFGVIVGKKRQSVAMETGVHGVSMCIEKERTLVAFRHALEPHGRGLKQAFLKDA